MKLYSTNKKVQSVSIQDAVLQGLATDGGLFMPQEIPNLPASFFSNLTEMNWQEIAFSVAQNLLGDDIEKNTLQKIVSESLDFDIPLVKLDENMHILELFHGNTLAFKDVGARFMARLLGHFIEKKQKSETTYILAATSGDTGSAVASGFHNVPNVEVILLYPKGMVSHIQEQQLTTYQGNIRALEIEGTFDDCQDLVKKAFLDSDLQNALTLTSANSINIARLIPQSFYYFYAVAQLGKTDKNIVVSVPSGNFGNLSAGLMAKRMGLNISKFIAANNQNNSVVDYLKTGDFEARKTIKTISNAMDVGNPSNFVRMLELYKNSHEALSKDIVGVSFDDHSTKDAMKEIFEKYNYIVDPHGAVGYLGLKNKLNENEVGIFLETAHPAKFGDVVKESIGKEAEIPERLKAFLGKEKKVTLMNPEFDKFKEYLMALK
jgi:threonine synthase